MEWAGGAPERPLVRCGGGPRGLSAFSLAAHRWTIGVSGPSTIRSLAAQVEGASPRCLPLRTTAETRPARVPGKHRGGLCLSFRNLPIVRDRPLFRTPSRRNFACRAQPPPAPCLSFPSRGPPGEQRVRGSERDLQHAVGASEPTGSAASSGRRAGGRTRDSLELALARLYAARVAPSLRAAPASPPGTSQIGLHLHAARPGDCCDPSARRGPGGPARPARGGGSAEAAAAWSGGAGASSEQRTACVAARACVRARARAPASFCGGRGYWSAAARGGQSAHGFDGPGSRQFTSIQQLLAEPPVPIRAPPSHPPNFSVRRERRSGGGRA